MAAVLRRVGSACLLWVSVAMVASALAQTPTTQKPIVKAVTAIPIVSLEGKDNYDAYCAVCHGATAKGNGPAAPAMKVPVPDLTTIAKRNNGKFIHHNVEEIIRGTGKTPTPAHGVETMPIWGDVFYNEEKTQRMLRIRNLVMYLESIQVK